MAKENENNMEPERRVPVIEKKIHKTHFPVIKIPLRNSNHDSGYEWVPSGNGRLKRVPKKKKMIS